MVLLAAGVDIGCLLSARTDCRTYARQSVSNDQTCEELLQYGAQACHDMREVAIDFQWYVSRLCDARQPPQMPPQVPSQVPPQVPSQVPPQVPSSSAFFSFASEADPVSLTVTETFPGK